MKPLSERIKDFPADQFVDWLCLSCVDVREVRSEEDAQGEIKKIRKAVTERLTALEKQRDALLGGFEEAIRHKDKLAAELNALAAENAILKSGIGFFSYGTDSGFEEHDSAEKAIAAADSDIDYYRGDACDGWSEETDRTVWGVIMQRATMIDERPRSEEFPDGSCDYALLPNLATPATDDYLNSVRADAVASFAHHHRVIADSETDPTIQRGHRITACRAEDFATQLRAGKDGE